MQPSDIDLLRYLDSIVDLDAEVAHGALDLGMSKQQLDSSEVAFASSIAEAIFEPF